MNSVRIYPLGEIAAVVEFGKRIDYETHVRVMALAERLEKKSFPGMIEYVPAYTTLTVYYDPLIVGKNGQEDAYQNVRAMLLDLAKVKVKKRKEPGRVVEIPVCYGGEFGPDLDEVAGSNKLSVEEVIGIHSGGQYLVYMLGFAPGFPYLGGMDERIATPRKATPRQAIPAGSVGIAGAQTGIYPLETPGGWQLIGRTPVSLFDPQREDPCLLRAGDNVRFVPITKEEYHKAKS